MEDAWLRVGSYEFSSGVDAPSSSASTASWISPVGSEPSLTAEQKSQNEARTHSWEYHWNEEDQQWDLTDTLV